MGIKNLLPFLRKKCPNAFENVKLDKFAYQKFAIDTPIFLYRFKVTNPYDYLSIFTNMIKVLRKHDVHPIFVFDGKNIPAQKKHTRERRKNSRNNIKEKIIFLQKELDLYEKTQKPSVELLEFYDKLVEKNIGKNCTPLLSVNSFNDLIIQDEIEKLKRQIPNITRDDIDSVKLLFEKLGIKYIEAPGEAEKLCASLKLQGVVDGIISEDSDILAYGSSFISKLDIMKGTGILIKYNKIIKDLEISPKSFRDLCILFGNDYNDNIPGIGPIRSFNYISKYNTIENIEVIKDSDKEFTEYRDIRVIFENLDPVPENTHYYSERPDIKELSLYLDENDIKIDKNGLIKSLTETTKPLFFLNK